MATRSSEHQRIDEPLYNSRLIRNYVEYVKKFHPEVAIDEILKYAWITTYELEDQGHWFSQWQVDRFHERLTRLTGDSKISRKVGRYAASSEASGALRSYTLGFMTPGGAYWVFEKIAPHATRASTFKSRKLSFNKFEIKSIPKRGVHLKPYQCENLIGQLEALSKLFTDKYPKIEHPECLHKGGQVCRYVITLEKSPSFVWRTLRNYLILPSLLACLALHFFISSISWTALIFLFTSIVLGISFYFEHLENLELTRNVEGQRDAVKLLLDQINRRYNDAQLVKEIGQATSMLLDIRRLLKSVIEAVENRLDFDRGGIWLANREKSRLIYNVGFGYYPDVEQLLKTTEFRLDNPHSRGVAVQAFWQQRPFLVNDIFKIEKDLSQKSLAFVKKLGTKSFICVPIVYERESLGVLFVDNLKSKRALSQSDISLLTGIATQIAISIRNAMSYQKLQQAKEQEQSLRELFEKYVPAPIIKRYLDSGEVDLFRGVEASITAMFLDIRGFTTSSESMEAKDVVSFLNSYFEKCSLIITEKNGHINKYTGDGLFAVFGAPERVDGHVALAFETARELLEMSKKFILEGHPMKIGIGLHTGRAILGNIGSQTKIEYTAIGDTVNTAARLQEFTKLFLDYPIIMSRTVWEKLAAHPDHKAIRNLGNQKIRGKKGTLEAFGFSPTESDAFPKFQRVAGLVPLQRIKGV
ncbi:MAG: adenylate/guanylate cyclase domain-containing protein [Desulfobacteraceae bacterium]|jgi:class 3 adenylate cyclase